MKKRWSEIRPGDVIELSGRAWTVERIAAKKKTIRVTVRSGTHVAESKVDPADKVRVTEKPEPLYASQKKRTKERKPAAPKPATGDPWETQQDRIERKLGEILGARLVGEATDVDAGYYVPPIDVSTVAAHLAIFHGGIPDTATSEASMLTGHAAEHGLADAGKMTLAVDHWHTEQRPTTGKKKGKR